MEWPHGCLHTWVLPQPPVPPALLAGVLAGHKVVPVGCLRIPALAGDARHGDVHSASVAFAFAPVAAGGDIDGSRAFLCLYGRERWGEGGTEDTRTRDDARALTADADAAELALQRWVSGVAPGPLRAVRVAAVVVIQTLLRVPG